MVKISTVIELLVLCLLIAFAASRVIGKFDKNIEFSQLEKLELLKDNLTPGVCQG